MFLLRLMAKMLTVLFTLHICHPCSVRKDHYKGMSEAEKKAVLATQLAQVW
jgi:hypothetical protein